MWLCGNSSSVVALVPQILDGKVAVVLEETELIERSRMVVVLLFGVAEVGRGQGQATSGEVHGGSCGSERTRHEGRCHAENIKGIGRLSLSHGAHLAGARR